MNIPLVIDEKDKKWILLGKILDIVTARRIKQEMAKQGIHPVRMAGVMFKIVLIAVFCATFSDCRPIRAMPKTTGTCIKTTPQILRI